MVSPAKIAEKLIKEAIKGAVPKEGKLEDGTLDGPAARHERGLKEAERIEKADKANRTA